MKRKILCLFLVLIMAVSVLASCGGGKKNDDPNENGNQNQGGGEYDVTWSKTDLKMKLSEHSNSQELTSGCKRYYAGGDMQAFSDLDTNVRSRNATAEAQTNVAVSYSYIYDNDTSKGWGGNIQDMITETAGGGSSADIYCNFAYDMTCAALRGCFSNLLDTTSYTNNFRFTKSDYEYDPDPANYLNSTAGEGYFYNYMRSLSLTPDTQLYCLASDYTIDVMRAFLVVPVNVAMINSIEIKEGAIEDLNGDAKHDINDFYKLVWNGDWTYSALAKYSNAIAMEGTTSIGATSDIGDERVGFAIGLGSGLPASGILYTTSVEIFNTEADGKFSYPAKNDKLNEVAVALNDLFTKNASLGICTVTSEEGKQIVPTAASPLVAIRERFAQNHVLFGSIIMVGSLEDSVYQGMKSNGGFGIVPVPLYKQDTNHTEEYKTLVHNVARIVAISKVTTKFAQCSAFLDYQSRNSAEILDDYYNEKLVAAVSSGGAGEENVKMLTYISNHVNDCFDKTYEDAIGNYMQQTEAVQQFHGILKDNKFQMSSFDAYYDEILAKKTNALNLVYNAWINLEK